MNRNFIRGLSISLLLVAGMSSCDPASAAELVSQPGQTMDSFVMSIRKDLAKASRDAGGVEVCGGIAEVDGRYVVELVPGERFQCEFTPPAGYTGTSVHTHPKEAAEGFSSGDYEAGPGYMVTRGFVYHQHGTGTARRVLR